MKVMRTIMMNLPLSASSIFLDVVLILLAMLVLLTSEKHEAAFLNIFSV